MKFRGKKTFAVFGVALMIATALYVEEINGEGENIPPVTIEGEDNSWRNSDPHWIFYGYMLFLAVP